MPDDNRMEPKCCACGTSKKLLDMDRFVFFEADPHEEINWNTPAGSKICTTCAMVAFEALWYSGEFARLHHAPTRKAWKKYAKEINQIN